MTSRSTAHERSGQARHIEIAGHVLDLDLSYKHERLYHEAIATGTKDIDTLIAERFMRPGDVVLDAGANIGFLTLKYLELQAAEVHAVEPIEALYTRLARLKDRRICTYCLALSDREGSARIFRSRSHNQGHTLNPAFLTTFPRVFGEEPEVETVRLATADRLFAETRFDFMKIDIEGSEQSFLRGGQQILSDRPPRAMQIEIYPTEFDAVDIGLRRYLPFRRRVAHDRAAGCLVLLDPTSDAPPGLKMDPPIYVYTSSSDAFA